MFHARQASSPGLAQLWSSCGQCCTSLLEDLPFPPPSCSSPHHQWTASTRTHKFTVWGSGRKGFNWVVLKGCSWTHLLALHVDFVINTELVRKQSCSERSQRIRWAQLLRLKWCFLVEDLPRWCPLVLLKVSCDEQEMSLVTRSPFYLVLLATLWGWPDLANRNPEPPAQFECQKNNMQYTFLSPYAVNDADYKNAKKISFVSLESSCLIGHPLLYLATVHHAQFGQK